MMAPPNKQSKQIVQVVQPIPTQIRRTKPMANDTILLRLWRVVVTRKSCNDQKGSKRVPHPLFFSRQYPTWYRLFSMAISMPFRMRVSRTMFTEPYDSTICLITTTILWLLQAILPSLPKVREEDSFGYVRGTFSDRSVSQPNSFLSFFGVVLFLLLCLLLLLLFCSLRWVHGYNSGDFV